MCRRRRLRVKCLDLRRAIRHIAELGPGDNRHQRIDLVELVEIPLAAVRRERAGAKPDDCHLAQPVLCGTRASDLSLK